MKKLSFLLLLSCSFSLTVSAGTSLDSLVKITKPEKVYVHTDRTLYSPEENIFYKIYVADGNSHKLQPNVQQASLYLLDAKGSIIIGYKVPITEGVGSGSISARDIGNRPAGKYKLVAYTNWQGNFDADHLFTKEIMLQKTELPKLLLKLEPDRKSYLPGQTVVAYFEARNLDGKAISNRTLHAELMYQGKIIRQLKATTDVKGKCVLSVILPDSLKENNLFFNVKMDFEGRYEAVGKPLTLETGYVDFQFMPEGGNLVAELNSRVAFRALLPNGKPADVSGEIVNENGTVITTFKSTKFGMGSFEFQPKQNSSYSALINSSNGKRTYKLPVVLNKGITLRTEYKEGGKLKAIIQSSEKHQAVLLLRSYDVLREKKVVTLEKGSNEFTFETTQLPSGITSLSVFLDEHEIPFCERLIFVNKNRLLQFEFEKNKEHYFDRDLVKLKMKVKDADGKPVEGNFSMSVVDEKNLNERDDKQDHILSWLLMSSELNGEIEEPSFYFDPSEELADQALDLVLMTHGWRRYNWEEIQNLAAIREKLIYPTLTSVLYGQLRYYENYTSFAAEMIKNVSVRYQYNSNWYTTYTDSLGRFQIPVSHFPGENLDIYVKRKAYRAKITLQRSYHIAQQQTGKEFTPFASNSNNGNRVNVQIIETKNTILPQLKQDAFKVENEVEVEKEVTLGMRGVRSSADFMKVSTVQGETDVASYLEVVPGVISQLESVEIVSMDRSLSMNMTSVASIRHVVYDSYDPNRYTYYWTSPYHYYQQEERYYPEYVYSTTTYSPSGVQFYSPRYSSTSDNSKKDERKTLYWNAKVNTDKNGVAEVDFFTADEISNYSIIVEGISSEGVPGRGKSDLAVKKKFSIESDIPAHVTGGDVFNVELVVRNSSSKPEELLLETELTRFEFADTSQHKLILNVPADSFVVLQLPVKVPEGTRSGMFKSVVRKGKDTGLMDQVSAFIQVSASGFENATSYSGNEKSAKMKFNIRETIDPNSIHGDFLLMISPFSELESGLTGMVREPYGCFEQVTSTNYPNILAMQYLNLINKNDGEFAVRSRKYLETGYEKLSKYITAEKGFSLYGASPANEMYTAVGILQFYELKKLGIAVKESELKNATNWLLSRRDGKGGFLRDAGTYGHASAPADIANAYIIYVLTKMGNRNLSTEIEAIGKDIDKSDEIYKSAIYANTLFQLDDRSKGQKLMNKLVGIIGDKGLNNFATGSTITRSGESYARVEALSWMVITIAENKLSEHYSAMYSYIDFIYSKRQHSGSFGSTQTTVMALRAIVAAKNLSLTDETQAGEIEFVVNGKSFGPYSYSSSSMNNLRLSGFSSGLQVGENTIEFKVNSENKIPPYTLSANWLSSLPPSKNATAIDLDLKYGVNSIKEESIIQLYATVSNRRTEPQGQTVAIIGIPGGATLDVKELKRLSDEKVFDYYEIKDNYLVIYFAELGPLQKKSIPINLRADHKGQFYSPASCAYLYYSPDQITWKNPGKISITQ